MFAVVALVAAPMTASAQQSLNLSIGGFSPRAETRAMPRRPAERSIVPRLQFATSTAHDRRRVSDRPRRQVRRGVGIGFYQRSTPAFDRFNGSRTRRSDRRRSQLRVVPMSATFRFCARPSWCPAVHRRRRRRVRGSLQRERRFVASDNVTIIHGKFHRQRTASGPVVLGGVRIPIDRSGGRRAAVSISGGSLPTTRGPAPTPKIDLGGWTYVFTRTSGSDEKTHHCGHGIRLVRRARPSGRAARTT